MSRPDGSVGKQLVADGPSHEGIIRRVHLSAAFGSRYGKRSNWRGPKFPQYEPPGVFAGPALQWLSAAGPASGAAERGPASFVGRPPASARSCALSVPLFPQVSPEPVTFHGLVRSTRLCHDSLGRLSMAQTRAERAYERYAWIILAALGIFLIFTAIFLGGVIGNPGVQGPAGEKSDAEYIAGMTWTEISASSPNVARLVVYELQTRDIFRAFWGVFVLAIAAYPYRRGERWSWYVLWILPVQFVVLAIWFSTLLGLLSPLGVYGSVAILAVVGLLLPYRRFFAKGEPRKSTTA